TAAPAPAYACKCETSSTFLDNAASGLVVLGTVVEHKGYDLRLKVSEVLAGDEKRPELWIHAGNGADCNAVVSTFPVGESFALILLSPEAGQYEINACGTYWLSLKGEVASGNVGRGLKGTIPLADLKARVQKEQRDFEARSRGK